MAGLPCYAPERAQYAGSVKDIMQRRWPPFAFVLAVLMVLSVAVARLPESLVEQLQRNSPLTGTQAGWAYRLLAAVAVAQVLYGGFRVLRVERVRKAQEVARRSHACRAASSKSGASTGSTCHPVTFFPST